MKFSSIASGSKGNCLLYENNDVKLLVDAGISKKRIEEGMSAVSYTHLDVYKRQLKGCRSRM